MNFCIYQVWCEKIENLKKGILSPKLVAGNGQRLDKDGSGRSSSFLGVSSISNYQNTIIVGTEAGKVKLISEIASVADFIENTFKVGVEGFGLQKKAGQRQSIADLDSCRVAHEQLAAYLEKLVEKVKSSFHYQLPSKLNGPEHSVSAVTVSAVKLASRSFLRIKKNIELTAGGEGSTLLTKVNPSSTTTKGVEHFHSLAHRKTMVQTVQEYIQTWLVIVSPSAVGRFKCSVGIKLLTTWVI